MIAHLILYTAAVGAVLAGAAWLAERALLAAGRAVRWAWVVGLALGVALPVVASVGAAARTPPASTGRASLSIVMRLPPSAADAEDGWAALAARVAARAATLAEHIPSTLAAPAAWAAFDRPLAGLWAGASALALWRLASAGRRARRLARSWERRALAGGEVRVSDDVGPAVLGVTRPVVVVPQWALSDARLPIMVAHECEHVRARDPLLVTVGAVVAALTPWSPAAWWQLRRLRAAVELDCDRRVLARQLVPPRAYGALLLDVAGRVPAAVPALALAAPPTLLHRRIEVMAVPRPVRVVPRALWPVAAAAGLVALACEVPKPTSPAVSTAAAPANVAAAAPVAAADPTSQRLTMSDSGHTVERVALGVDGRPLGQPARVPARRTMLAVGDTTGARPAGRVRRTAPAPLYVLDGEAVTGDARADSVLGTLDQSRIATVNVLKGELATRKYGGRGANGVVEIVTTAAAAARAPEPPAAGEPRYVVDGQPVTRAEAAAIAPDRIATVNVVKGEGRSEVLIVTKAAGAP